MHQQMTINTKIKTIAHYVWIVIAIYLSYFWFFVKQDGDDIEVCNFKKIEVKGKISRIVHGKLLYFEIDNLEGKFYAPISIFSKTQFKNCNKGEIYEKQVGDSIIKKANSKFVKFKRGDKVFIEELALKGCD